MWMSKHHYANELANLGFEVFFINPPEAWSLKNLVTKPKIRKEGKVNVVTINNKYPIVASVSRALRNDRLNLIALRSVGILNDKSLVWNFDGRRFAGPGCKMIYHIVDYNKSTLLDDLISKNSDLIVCTSERFTEDYQNVSCQKIVIPHGVSSEEFRVNLEEKERIKKKYGNFILSIGSFSKKSNLELLQLTADSFPEYTLLLLGQNHLKKQEDWQKLINSNNVNYIGIVPAKELKNYISAAALCLTCYHFDHASRVNSGAASSLKNMHYLAQNKVTISTLANDIDHFQNRGIYSARNNRDFISLINKGLEGNLLIETDLIQSEFKALLYPKLIQKILTQLINGAKVKPFIDRQIKESISGENILVVSNESWGDVWYSKQNYAYELSKNNQVIFINPVGRWRPKSLFSAKISKTKYSDSLSILNYHNAIPVRASFLDRWNNKITSKRLRKYLLRTNFHNHIFWTFDPFRLYEQRLLGAKIGIYHCVDLYGFKFYGENQIATNADLIFVSSNTFLNTYQDYDKPKFLLPHGISSEEFTVNPTEANKIKIDFANYGLYTGVIDNRIDFELLEKALIKFKDVPFLFIGPLNLSNDDVAHRIFIDKKYPNLIALGPVHFKKLKVYISQAKFCISFMDTKIEGNMIAHHKSLHYLSHGKPVFGAAFSEYKNLHEIFYMSNSHDELLNMLSEFIANGEQNELVGKRITYAREFTFENLLSQANKHIKTISD